MALAGERRASARLRILQAAWDLFHKQGIHLTSPEQVMEASDTGQRQFYHYFKNKDGLIHEVLQAHLESMTNGTCPIKFDLSSWKELEDGLPHISICSGVST